MAKAKKSKESEPRLHDLIKGAFVEPATTIMDGVARLREREGLAASAAAVAQLQIAVANADELLEVPAAARLQEDLAWYGTPLDRIADLERVSARVESLIAELPAELVVGRVASQLETELQTSRQRAWTELLPQLDSDRAHQLLSQLHRWRSDPPLLTGTDRPARKLKGMRNRATDRLARRLDTVRAALTHDPHLTAPDTVAALNRALAAQRRSDQLAALAGDEPGAHPLEELRLSRQTGDLLRGEGIRVGVRSGHNGFSYGLLYAIERQHQHELAGRI